MTCAGYKIKTGPLGDGMTQFCPRNDEIPSLDASGWSFQNPLSNSTQRRTDEESATKAGAEPKGVATYVLALHA